MGFERAVEIKLKGLHGYRYDSDLEFLRRLSSNDLKDLFDVLVYDEDGALRVNEELTSSTEYKRHGNDYAKYPTRIAEELQCYGSNTFINFFRDEGVLYKEILCDACDHLKRLITMKNLQPL